MLRATNIIKISDRGKIVYCVYGIALDGLDSWSFGSNFARNIVIFCVDNSSSFYSDYHKNKFLKLGEEETNW